MGEARDRKSVGLFLLITLVLSTICYYIRIKGGDAAAGMTSILMFCPAAAAFIVRARYYPKEKILGWNRCEFKYILLSIIIPIIYLGLSYGPYWIFKPTAFTGKAYSDSVVTLLLLIPSAILPAAGEEIGWRGFLLPRMAQLWNVKVSIILSGLIWAVWHFPLMIAGVYNSGTSVWYQLPMFVIEVIAMTAIMAYFRFKSKSVWPAIIFHASHNYFDQLIFGPLTKASKQAYFVGETGFVTAIIMIIIALIIIKKWGVKHHGVEECENIL